MAPIDAGWAFDNTYARLPEPLFARVMPTPVKAPQLAILNEALATSLGLNPSALQTTEGIAQLAGNAVPAGAEPLAQAYAGHQFGHLNMLGDGRAILLGEHQAPSGARVDIQLKGPGRTPYSRRGDGRAALGPMLREYIISEAMHAMGVPTTRSLAVVTTGEPVFRETALPGAILTRIATSHLRVGTFEFAAGQRDDQLLSALADYAIARHPFAGLDLRDDATATPYLRLLYGVIERQARLIAQWQCLGFIHGVMNTDNMTISGETIDYGPCAFMDAYDPATAFSSIDHQGRYAYENQPTIARWNLVRFAEAILPLLHADDEQAIAAAQEALDSFPVRFQRHWLQGMRDKLGLHAAAAEDAGDVALINDLLAWMHQQGADFTNTFRALSTEAAQQLAPIEAPSFAPWHARWTARHARQRETRQAATNRMRAHNPAVIPRNHRVEAALAAAQQGDLGETHRLLAALARPYEDIAEFAEFRDLPPAGHGVYQTFCGT